jgi:hypothetical protein
LENILEMDIITRPYERGAEYIDLDVKIKMKNNIHTLNIELVIYKDIYIYNLHM